MHLSNYPSEKYNLAGGEVTIWSPGDGLLITQVRGRLSLIGAIAMDVAFQRMRDSSPRYRGFHDWSMMTDYEVAAFARLTQCSMRVVDRIVEAHFLLRSRVVDIGVTTANVLLKKIIVHRDPQQFQAAMESALRRTVPHSGIFGVSASAGPASESVRALPSA